LDGVEDASEETLRFGSCSGAYIKLCAASVWDCFNVNVHYTVPCNCASAVDTALMCYSVTVCVNQQ
jgi:hypothetical protein